ncbi:hypothetical protein K9M09_01170 [Patescibacteria group bacterium]|nr:hypothetical protein [Patescibacteria group bacterium]
MKKNYWIFSAIAIVVIVILLILDPLGLFQKTPDPCPQSDTNVRVGLDVSSDSLIHMYQALAAAEAEITKLKESLHNCEEKNGRLQSLLDACKAENAKLKVTDGKLRREIDALKNKLSGSGSQSSSSYQAGAGQNVSSSYTAPNPAPVTNMYSPEAPGAQEFCVNIRTSLNGIRDASSYWPHLEADPPTSVVAESVLNGEGTGWNVKLPPVKQISGLYGWSHNLRVIFVRVDLINKFGPTNVSMSGGMNGWPKIWPFAQRETINGIEYYVTHY